MPQLFDCCLARLCSFSDFSLASLRFLSSPQAEMRERPQERGTIVVHVRHERPGMGNTNELRHARDSRLRDSDDAVRKWINAGTRPCNAELSNSLASRLGIVHALEELPESLEGPHHRAPRKRHRCLVRLRSCGRGRHHAQYSGIVRSHGALDQERDQFFPVLNAERPQALLEVDGGRAALVLRISSYIPTTGTQSACTSYRRRHRPHCSLTTNWYWMPLLVFFRYVSILDAGSLTLPLRAPEKRATQYSVVG